MLSRVINNITIRNTLHILAAKSNWHRRNTSTRGYERYQRAIAAGTASTKDYSSYRDNKSFLVEVKLCELFGSLNQLILCKRQSIKRMKESEVCYVCL